MNVYAAVKKCTIEQYMQEGLLALLPVYDNGDRSAVITRKKTHSDPRGVSWLLGRMAAFYKLDLALLRRRCAELLNRKHHISLPLNENLVLVPLKVRQATEPGETTMGYVNMLQVKRVLPLKDEPPYQARVILEGGLELDTINQPDTVEGRIRHGQIVLADYVEKHGSGVRFKGLQREDLLGIMPNCDCLLREVALILYHLNPTENNLVCYFRATGRCEMQHPPPAGQPN
jgi:hypothetical protein